MLDTIKAHLSPPLFLFRTALAAIWIDKKNNPDHPVTDVGKQAYRIYESLPDAKKMHLLYEFLYQTILAYNTAALIIEEKKQGHRNAE